MAAARTKSATNDLATWDGEGGAPVDPAVLIAPSMTGSEFQAEWAHRIWHKVNAEFDRVAASFRVIAEKQQGAARADTEAIIAIVEDKRGEVLARPQAGYFIHDWQDISDQVRQLVFHDARYQAIKSHRNAGSGEAKPRMESNTTMSIRPLYDRIVVKRTEEQETSRNGIIIPDSAKEKPQEGEVMAIGHGKRLENGTLVELEVKVGDRVLFGKYSGTETKLVGTEYMIMREDDVLCILDPAAQPAQ